MPALGSIERRLERIEEKVAEQATDIAELRITSKNTADNVAWVRRRFQGNGNDEVGIIEELTALKTRQKLMWTAVGLIGTGIIMFVAGVVREAIFGLFGVGG
jgi:hypothetical protein